MNKIAIHHFERGKNPIGGKWHHFQIFSGPDPLGPRGGAIGSAQDAEQRHYSKSKTYKEGLKAAREIAASLAEKESLIMVGKLLIGDKQAGHKDIQGKSAPPHSAAPKLSGRLVDASQTAIPNENDVGVLQVIKAGQVEKVRSALIDLFSGSKTQKLARRLTFPGQDGPFNASILWREDKAVWAYFSERPVQRDRKAVPRWLCWFGINPGEDGRPLTPNVEINLSADPTQRQIFGRALVGPDGSLFLGHKGGLGGGQGGQMTMLEFQNRIRGFAPEPVLHADDREESVLVIGAINSPNFVDRLREFVAECDRLRSFARERAHKSVTEHAGDSSPNDEMDDVDDFSRENETAGTGIRTKGKYLIERLHGRVVNALAKNLEAMGYKGINKKQGTLRPDLFLKGRNGEMTILFEVKVSSDPQSWFTALGQLLVYGAGHSPRRILVAPAPLQNPAFATAMRQLQISLITFKEGKHKSIHFDGIEALNFSEP